LQINYDTQAEWHTDHDAQVAIVVGIGRYEGGQLEVKGYGAYDLLGKALLFDPNVCHRTLPARGSRIALRATLHEHTVLATDDDLVALRELGFRCDETPTSDTSEDDEDGCRRTTPQEAMKGRPPR